jgi:hypothetical protein
MHDLDALVPKPIPVRIGGVVYHVPPRDGMPLSAIPAAKAFAADESAQGDPVRIAEFLAQITPIPGHVLAGLRVVQLKALLALIFPPEDESVEDPTQRAGATSPAP